MSISTPIPDADQLALLADAIADVGYWTWWTQKLPDAFQVEYAGTQLYFAPPTSPDQPPSSRVALQFQQPTCVCFLYRGQETTDFVWVEQLHEDQLPPPTCSYDGVAFGDDTLLRTLLTQATQQHHVHGGYVPTDEAFLREPFRLVSWCGDYGIALAAPAMRVMTHAGELALDQLAEVNRQWWEYWRTYWTKRFTTEPLPYDYACETTIPLEDFSTAPDSGD